MYSRSLLEVPVSPGVMSSAVLFLVKGDALADDTISKVEARDKPEPSRPAQDLEDRDQQEKEHCGDERRGRSNAVEEFQEKDTSKDCCETRLVGGDDMPRPVDSALDDGFKTPVTVDHKIASALECPPAPKKPKALPWRKRKLPPCDGRSDHRVSLLIHLSDEEVEAMFPPIVPSEAHNNEIKKARRGNSCE